MSNDDEEATVGDRTLYLEGSWDGETWVTQHAVDAPASTVEVSTAEGDFWRWRVGGQTMRARPARLGADRMTFLAPYGAIKMLHDPPTCDVCGQPRDEVTACECDARDAIVAGKGVKLDAAKPGSAGWARALSVYPHESVDTKGKFLGIDADEYRWRWRYGSETWATEPDDCCAPELPDHVKRHVLADVRGESGLQLGPDATCSECGDPIDHGNPVGAVDIDAGTLTCGPCFDDGLGPEPATVDDEPPVDDTPAPTIDVRAQLVDGLGVDVLERCEGEWERDAGRAWRLRIYTGWGGRYYEAGVLPLHGDGRWNGWIAVDRHDGGEQLPDSLVRIREGDCDPDAEALSVAQRLRPMVVAVLDLVERLREVGGE